jgi:hypothetical protein
MALSDYRLCDICDGKVFYDTNLNYDFDAPYSDKLMGQPLDYLGDWKVICTECAETHECVIIKKGETK